MDSVLALGQTMWFNEKVMIPLRDDIPTRTIPVVTIAVIAVNVAVYFFQLNLDQRELWYFIHRFGVIPKALVRLTDPFPGDGFPSVLTLGTSLFIHGGLVHLGSNMLFLWIFGNNVEDFLGHVRYLLFYLFCGLAATLVHTLTSPLSVAPLVGASGAIAGVMGAYLVLYPQARIQTLILIIIYPLFIWIPAVLFLVFWLAIQFINAGGVGEGGVAWMAHIGGFFCGVLLINRVRKKRRPAWRRGPDDDPSGNGPSDDNSRFIR